MGQDEASGTANWTAQDEARQSEHRMDIAEEKLNEKDFLAARTELNLALFHLKRAEDLAEKAGQRLVGIHRARRIELVLKLRLRDHILNLLGM